MPSTVRITNLEGGAPRDATSVVLSDPTGAYGIWDTTLDVLAVPAGTACTRIATGIYYYDISLLDGTHTYRAYFKIVHTPGVVTYTKTDIPIDSSTRVQLRSYILSKLGYPSVAVELGDEQLDLAIDESLRLFNQYMYKSEYKCEQSLSANKVIDIDSASMGVVRGEFVEVDEYKDAYPDVFTLYRRLRMMPQGGDYFFRKSYRTAYRRVLDKLPSWRYDEANLKLYAFIPSSSWHFTFEIAYEYGLDEVPKGYHQLLRQATEGFARQVLADIRGKYGNTIPGATTDVSLDGQAQRELGQKLIDEVKVRLSDLRESPTPIWM